MVTRPDDLTRRHHVAQLSIGILRAHRDDPMIAGFMAALEPINALADASPGFVWRLETPEGNATALRPFEDDRILVNMSVWESIEALDEFTYRSAHTGVMRQRRDWFQRMEGRIMVLWWIPVGHIPTIEQARERLALLERDGASPIRAAGTPGHRWAGSAHTSRSSRPILNPGCQGGRWLRP